MNKIPLLIASILLLPLFSFAALSDDITNKPIASDNEVQYLSPPTTDEKSDPANGITPGITYNINGFLVGDPIALLPIIKEKIDYFIIYMKENPSTKIRVEGHSDNAGTRAQNDQRSNKRADLVKQYLIEQGIELERITSLGRGSIFPLAPNTSPANRSLNRRVSVVISE